MPFLQFQVLVLKRNFISLNAERFKSLFLSSLVTILFSSILFFPQSVVHCLLDTVLYGQNSHSKFYREFFLEMPYKLEKLLHSF